MVFLFSAKKRGFYRRDLHKDIPSDAVEITQEKHAALMTAQSQGKIIQSDENGYPIAVEPPPAPKPPAPTYDEQRQAAILEKWPMSAQLEALTEAAEDPPRAEKMNQLLADIQAIKEQYPKPEADHDLEQ